MLAYAAKRLTLAIPTLFLVMILTFLLVRLVPGDVLLARIGESGMVPTDEARQEFRERLGLDDPLPVQFATWMFSALRGDFGDSLWTETSTMGRIGQALEPTLQLGVASLAIALVIAIPMGVISAVKRNSATDYAARFVAIGGISLPDFWIGLMVIIALSRWFGYFPGAGFVSFFDDPVQNIQRILLPALILGCRTSASLSRVTRSAMLEVLNADYIRTSRAKGLKERQVVVRHALRNALIPVITLVGSLAGIVVGGTVIMETLFVIPGMGSLTLNAIVTRDYTQIQANIAVLATFVLLVNVMVDLLYGVVDPRVRY